MAKIQPLQDRVIVKRFESEEKTASGIFIPDSAKEKPQEGQVVAVGAGKYLDNGNNCTAYFLLYGDTSSRK